MRASLLEKLQPYLNVRGVEAISLLREKPLRLSISEALTLNKIVMSAQMKALVIHYNRDAGKDIKFSSLPAEAQTVIADVAYQYGPNLKIRTPSFWGYVTSQNWARAAFELRHFGDAYPSRRKKEAVLLERAVK